MEKKKLLLVFTAMTVGMTASAQYKTAGDGQTYSFEKLSQTAGSGVSKTADGYTLTQSDTISAGDHFQIDKGVTVRLGDKAELVILGTADLQATSSQPTTLTTTGNDATPYGIYLMNETGADVAYLHFEYNGLRAFSDGSVNVSHTTFKQHNGQAFSAAIMFSKAGTQSTIEQCTFEDCQKAAIGSAANASQPLVIKDCILTRNSAANGNVPQINVTVASPLTISGCTITGNPANTMVGGIGVSNFMLFSAVDVVISNNTVTDNRYGIGLTGPAASIRIEHNQLINNNHETNAMNGGSGISLYDPYLQTKAVITGNRIENSLWGVTVIGCADVNLGRTDVSETDERYNPGVNTFKDNGNGGQLYDLYNNSANTVYAQGNTWNVSEQTQALIETVIFHKADNASLGEVIFWPAASAAGVIAPQLLPADNQPSWYNLSGSRIPHPTHKGLYIANGKKVVL